MASIEGPAVAISQAVNLSVNENTNNVQSEPLSLSANNASKSSSADTSTQPEKVSLPTTDTSNNDNLKPTTVNNSTSDILPTSVTTPKKSPENTDTKPANNDDQSVESTPTTKSESPNATKASDSADVGAVPTTTTDKPENLSQTKDSESESKATPDKSCKPSNEVPVKANCENTAPPPSKSEKPSPPEEMEVDKTPANESSSVNTSTTTSTITTTVNGGSSVTSTPVQSSPVSKPVATIKPMVESADSSNADETKPSHPSTVIKTNNKRPTEDPDEPEKRLKTTPSSSPHSSSSGFKGRGKTPEEILEYMEKTFEHRRKIITKQMPTIPELKEQYPDLFRDKQLVTEFQRITKIDIDKKIQEFCVRNATAVIEMARSKKGAQPVLARWEQAKQENETLKQYWDMVTALCLLPLHFGENFVEMVLEIEEDEEVQAQGKIVPTLVARGNIFRTDEFFLIAENTIVQEFEEFTIAFASLYSSYWVFNMVYPETIENTYNFIQRCIVKQKEPGAIPTVCKNFTKTLQKWNRSIKKS